MIAALMGCYLLTQLLATSTRWEMAGIAASIAAAAFGLLIIVGGAIVWLRVRRPVRSLTYLIPQSEYPAKQFAGAPSRELSPSWLTIGIGDYILPFRIVPRTEIVVDEVLLDFVGANSNSIRIVESANPFIVEIGPPRKDGRVHIRDWHGMLHNASGPGPVVYKANMPWVLGFRIRTAGVFDGSARLRVLMRGRSPLVRSLHFRVDATDGRDDIGFLRDAPGPSILSDER